MQIATPSRGAIEAYGNLQSDVAKLVSDVNGLHGEVDWTPIRYLNKGYSQAVLAGLYRTAQVGVVTPLQDGMNLVAKEYVAAQNPVDPGVLVLSKFAGAANELDTALQVNPHDIDGMARTIAVALSMPLAERRMRWEAMMTKLRAGTIQQWFADFTDALWDSRSSTSVLRKTSSPSRSACGSYAPSTMVARGITSHAFQASVFKRSGYRFALENASRIKSSTTRHPAPRSAPCSARSDFPSAPCHCPCRRTRRGR